MDNQRRSLEFMVGNQVFLKVVPWNNIVCFGMKGKLALKYIGPFEFIERIGLISYQLALPSYLARIHDVFNVSLLQKVKLDLTRVLPQVSIEIRKDLTIEV